LNYTRETQLRECERTRTSSGSPSMQAWERIVTVVVPASVACMVVLADIIEFCYLLRENGSCAGCFSW